jgi:acyl transferase domain-containing protein
LNSVDRTQPVPVAIIGMACMFPKAEDLSRYWSNIRDRIDAITAVPESHWDPADYFNDDPSAPDHTYARRGGFLTPVDFPPLEFGIAPNNIEATDTTQLLGLMVAKQALDDAGYGAGAARTFDRSRTSVILGVTGTLELVIPLGARLGHPIWRRALKAAGIADDTAESVVQSIAESYVPWQENSFPGLLGNVAAGRIANRLDLGGTNCVVDAACASSLGAVNLALFELASGRSDMVLTGGLDTFNDIFMYMCFSKTPALSPSGDARPFDAGADGTILGEGLGVVVLKRLDDARRDGDRIYAVIRSVGTSSDGKGNAVYAPSAQGQAQALRQAYAIAGASPETVELVEAHGTGTKVGDATELEALCEVYREARGQGTWCALGSVKSQIGHTKAAAGAAGLIKAALALHNKVLPPTAKVTQPIAGASPGASPFYVNTEARPWMPRSGHPRRAAVSAFGFGGSNFHCVLEEAEPAKTTIEWDGDVQILAFSASNARTLGDALAAWPRDLDWGELRRQAALARKRFQSGDPCRLVLVVERGAEIGRTLDRAGAVLAQRSDQAFASPAEGIFVGSGALPGGLALLFPGQGSQYVGMLRDLACRFPGLHAMLAEADRGLANGRRLGELIYPLPAFTAEAQLRDDQALRATDAAQPAIGAVSLGLLEIVRQFGVEAEATAGHSFGEIPALCAAGRIDTRSALELARLRGRLMAGDEGADRGAMLAVMAPLELVESVIRETGLKLVVANKNAPQQVVLSGASDEVARAGPLFVEREIATRRLAVSAAFHSDYVADASQPLLEAIRKVNVARTGLPVYSNTTAQPYPDDPDQARVLLANQLARPVDFAGSIQAMYGAGIRTFLEVGPGSTLTNLVDAILSGRGATALSVDASRGQRGNVADLAKALARLSALGYPVALERWDEGADARPAPARKPGLTIKVSGANARPRARPAADRRPATPPRSQAAGGERKTVTSTPTQHTAHDGKTSMNSQNGDTHAATSSGTTAATRLTSTRPIAASSGPVAPGDAGLLTRALAEARESMLALQKLGEQTAKLHRQFLDGQEKTQRAFQTLIEQQQRLVHSALGTRSDATSREERAHVEPVQTSPAVTEHRPRFAAPAAPPGGSPRSHEPREAHVPAPQPVVVSKPPKPVATRVQDVLLDVVAEKTGYPTEMLEPGMELDADLGIDSIKRVEILSALQERLPDAPTVKPEHLGTLRTLGQIIEFLQGGETAAVSTAVNGAAAWHHATFEVVLEVVAEKTGYPPEMLEPSMELDADLGIDSIKRVEILSALQERLPDAPVAKPEHLASLRTLGQVAAFLGENAPVSAVNGASAPALASAPNSIGTIHDTLVAVVAEKTGYPAEMLEPSMELDADLGIDSIKRVEILSALQDRLPDAPEVKPEHLGSLRTLGAIVEFLAGGSPVTAGFSAPAVNGSAAVISNGDHRTNGHPIGNGEHRVAADVSAPVSTLQRLAVRHAALSDSAHEPGRAVRPGGEYWIVGGEPGLPESLVSALTLRGYRAQAIDPSEIARLRSPDMLDGLILLGPANGGNDRTIKEAFQVLRTAAAGLRKAGRERGSALAVITWLDGAFGTRDYPQRVEPIASGLAGLAKTAAHEWPEVDCKAIDLDPATIDRGRAAEVILDELFRSGPIEVGRRGEDRVALELVPEELSVFSGAPPIARGDLVVVSGGGRGVTAEVAVALADAFKPTLLILGRSPEPIAEPDWLAALHGEADVKRALASRANGHATPKIIADQFERVAANREVLRTIERIERSGATVLYRSVDVRDADAVSGVLEEARSHFGPVRGLIHGAGVLADRRIEDQTDEQFSRVYDTKVAGLRSLLHAVERDDLRAIVLFSSSTARFGRQGQVAYAAANEVLNKYAQREAKARPNCKVVALNWGPWDGGMVTDALKPLFEAEGVGLIPLAEGARLVAEEFRSGRGGSVEVVVLGPGTRSVPTVSERPATRVIETPALSPVFERAMDVASMPVLRAHVLDGRPVLPLALIIEWLAHGALQRNPGLTFCGVDDLRVLKGVIVREEQPEVVRVLAGKAVKREQNYVVPVELRGMLASGREVPHARGQIVLAERLGQGFQAFPAQDLPPFGLSVSEAYERLLFHGPELQGLQRIDGCGDAGIAGFASASPPPAAWFKNPLRQAWLSDPLAIDCAFQAMIVWTCEQLGAGSLPTAIGVYRQFRREFPASGVRIIARVTQSNASRAVADIEFLDAEGACIALIEDYECVVDASLNQAFRRNQPIPAARA